MTVQRSLAIICPVYNEASSLRHFFERVDAVQSRLAQSVTVDLIFVNNASTDETYDFIQEIRQTVSWVHVITHSRNFGYQASVLCGIKSVDADAYVVIDVDCEDPPELILQFVEKWLDGYDLVYGERVSRPESFVIVAARRLFYLVTRLIADSDFVLYMAEFSLFSRRVREQVIAHRSTFPFVRSDLAYAGFRRHGIPYARERRRFGRTHYNFLGMWKFAIAGVLSASTFPLRVIAYLGFPLAFADLCYAAWKLILGGHEMEVLVAANLSMVAGALGFVAVYLARVSKDVVGRAVYIVDDTRTFVKTSSIATRTRD